MVPCCAAAAAYAGDGVLHALPGAAVAGAAPPQLCQLPILLAGPYAHAGPAPALPCLALPCPAQVLLSSCCCHRHNCNVVLQCCPAPACCILRAAVLQAATAVAMLCGLLEIINL